MLMTDFKYDKTMQMLSNKYPIMPGTEEGNGIESILKANGLNEDVNILTRGDTIYLLQLAVHLGKIIGVKEERTRRKNGNQKNKD